MADRTYYRVETADYQIDMANAINAARCVRLLGAESSLVAVQPPQPAEAFFGNLAAWHVNAVRFMVNEKRWLGGPPNPKNTQPILVPGVYYSAVLYCPEYGGGPAVGWLIGGTRPLNSLSPQLAAANHRYNDTYDKTDLGCPNGSAPACWNHRLGIVAAQVPLVTTEPGERDCNQRATFIDSYRDWADTKPSSGRDSVS